MFRVYKNPKIICSKKHFSHDGLYLILTFQTTFLFCFRPASVFLPFCFRSAGKVAKCFRSFRGPLEDFFGKPHLALECLQSGPVSAKKICFRFASVLLPFCFRYAGKVIWFQGFRKRCMSFGKHFCSSGFM